MALLVPLQLQRNLNFDWNPGYPKGFLLSYRELIRQVSHQKNPTTTTRKKVIPAAKNIPFSLNHFFFIYLFIFFFYFPPERIWSLPQIGHRENSSEENRQPIYQPHNDQCNCWDSTWTSARNFHVATTKGKALLGNRYLFLIISGLEMMKHTNMPDGRTSEQLSKHQLGKTKSLDKNSPFFSVMSMWLHPVLYCILLMIWRKNRHWTRSQDFFMWCLVLARGP